MRRTASILIFLVSMINLSGCATTPLRITDLPYLYTEINATKEDIFDSTVKIINAQNLSIAKASKEEGYIATEYTDTVSGITKGMAIILSGVTAAQYAYILEIHGTDNLDNNILITRIIFRWKRIGGGLQYFTDVSKKAPFYKKAQKIAIEIKEVAENKK